MTEQENNNEHNFSLKDIEEVLSRANDDMDRVSATEYRETLNAAYKHLLELDSIIEEYKEILETRREHAIKADERYNDLWEQYERMRKGLEHYISWNGDNVI